jgi:predicted  nucleic acid-binding Zn ribbon protein
MKNLYIIIYIFISLTGCTTLSTADNKKPETPGEKMIFYGEQWVKGEELIKKGEKMIQEGQAQITEGKQLIEKGKQLMTESEKTIKIMVNGE